MLIFKIQIQILNKGKQGHKATMLLLGGQFGRGFDANRVQADCIARQIPMRHALFSITLRPQLNDMTFCSDFR